MRNAALIGAALALGATLIPIPEPEQRREPEPPPTGPDGIPDRVSLESDSPFYFKDWRDLGVKINGGLSQSVVEFCVSEGWARTQIFHGGRAKVERGKFVTVTRRGTIEPFWRRRP